MSSVYLDYAAATPLDLRVLTVMQPYFSNAFYNPSAIYAAAQKVSDVIGQARADIAHCLGVRPVEIIFTAGGTEANNLALQGILRKYTGAKVVVSAVEHDSVLEPARRYDHAIAAVNDQGIIDIDRLAKLIDDTVVLVSVMYANNEIGVVQPLREIAAQVATIRSDRRKRGIAMPLYFHTDATQAPNYLDVHTDRLGVDLMTLNGGKIYGPKQSGALYVKTGVQLEPLLYGGGQESGVRSGTENVAAMVGFAAALRLAQQTRPDESRRLRGLQGYFINELRRQIPYAIVNGSLKRRLPNNVHITVPGQDNERLLFALDDMGVQTAAGSACSASNGTPSHVLRAIGLTDAAAMASLRFSMGRATTRGDIDTALHKLSACLA